MLSLAVEKVKKRIPNFNLGVFGMPPSDPRESRFAYGVAKLCCDRRSSV